MSDAGNREGSSRVPSFTRMGRTPGIAPRVPKWGPPTLGLAAATIGGVYLAAWWTGEAARWSASGTLTMKTNMALALVMAGTALSLLAPGRTAPRRRTAGTALAAAVGVIGILTLVEHVFRVDLRVDQVFAAESPGAFATASPNRIGPPGALSLTLLGIGLLGLARRRRIPSYAALATAVIVIVPGIGFLYGITQLYGEAVTGIAWPTVIALLLLSIGLVVAQGREGPLGLIWSDDPGGAVLRQLLPAAVLTPFVVQLLRLLGERRGLYGRSTGIAIELVAIVLVLSALLWRSALRLSAAAVHTAAAQEQASWRADLLGLAHDAILVWSPVTGIESWNEGAVTLYGYSSAEAIGRSSHDLLLTVFPRPVSEIEEELRSVGHWEGELRHRTKDGREVVVSSKLRLVQGIDGFDRVLETNRDITERKHMEEELREAGRRKDEFLGVLSHELRNPLAPIRNSLYVLEHAEPTGQQTRRAKEVIGRQVAHLARLIDDLLEVTRISRGKIQLRRARLDLGDLVRRTGEDHRALFQGRGLEYSIDIPARPVWVEGDETRLAQIIGNLLQNSAKFTPARGQVTLSLVVLDSAAEIHVRDTGAGIEPGLVERMFEPFVQAEQTLARTEGGLGLGLALVKALAELHGGSVDAQSEGHGKGAEFIVRLPTVPATGAASDPVAQPRAPGRLLRVLVVDDNVDAAESLAEVVRMFGHDAEVAHDGPTAVEKAAATAPDLVLCDIGMPGMSGYDVARAFRSIPRLTNVRMVAVSGYAQPEDLRRAAEAGFVGHIPKPPDPAMLQQFLR